MPRLTRVAVRPNIEEDERGQIVSNFMEQLKQYYRQTSEETIFNLASTIEKQAFRDAQTRHQYSDKLTSLSAQEIDKAIQVYEEICGRISCPGTWPAEAGMRGTHSSTCDDHRIIKGNSDGISDSLCEKDKKVKQKLARQRIIARQRKRTRPVSNYVQPSCQEPPGLSGEGLPCNTDGIFSSLSQNDLSHLRSRPSKRLRTDNESSTTDTMEWYNRLIDTTDPSISSSFLEELSASDFGGSEDREDMKSRLSSTGSRAPTLIDFE